MIENALRKQLLPTVRRRQNLYLATRLLVIWLALGLCGAALAGADWYWGWRSPAAELAIGVFVVLATFHSMYRTRRIEPDYRKIARDIERKCPELNALLRAAVEQQPRPDGQLGYLQEQVIGEALRHGSWHSWTQSVSPIKLFAAEIGAMAAFVLLIVVMSPGLLRLAGHATAPRPGVARLRSYQISVSPGDAEIETDSPVVITARFDGLLPSTATLVYETEGQGSQTISLKKNLDDPVFAGVIQSVAKDTVYRVEYDDRNSRDYKLSVYTHPALRRADARIVYPAYTKLPERIVEETRHISAVEGSDITLTFMLNKPVATARLQAKDGSVLDLSVDPNRAGVYGASLKAADSQRYELHLEDTDGRKNKMPPRFTIDVHKNLPPELKPIFPNRDITASAIEELTLEAEVSDDYGLEAYGLTYMLAGTDSRDVALGDTAEAKSKQSIEYLLALEDVQARPDQLVTYYFWADDIGPNGEARRSYSDMYFAEIRPFEEIFRESQSAQDENSQQQREQQDQQGQQDGQQQAGQLAQLQKEIINATWNVKRKADQTGDLEKQKEDLEVVRQSQQDALQQAQAAQGQAENATSASSLGEAARHMQTSLEHLTTASESAEAQELKPALAAEQAAYQELLKLRDRESQVARSRSNQRQSSQQQSARSRQGLQQLELRQQQDRYESERSAQPQEEQAQRQDLQMLNRLRELARHQNDMSQRLREAEAALRQAENEQQRQESQRELQRLREQQLQAMRDLDELQEQMDRSENRQRTREASRQLDRTRSQMQQSAEQLQQQLASEAATSAARAGRELDQMREEFQNRTAGRFTEEMRQMREQARELDESQQQVAQDMAEQTERKQQTLSGPSDTTELAERMEQQQTQTRELMDDMRDVSEQAEESEPLLHRRLYDTLREASTGDLERSLEMTEELLRRSFLPEAQEIEQRAGEGIRRLREGVEEAAEGVLGSESESLRLARREVEELIRQVNEEMAELRGGRGDPNSPQDPNEARAAMASAQGEPSDEQRSQRQQDQQQSQQGSRQGQQQDQQQNQQANQRQGQGRQENQQANQRQGQGRQGDQQQRDMQARGGDRNQQQGGRTGEPREVGVETANDTTGGPGGLWRDWTNFTERRGPITGRDFRDWSDRLREVEEMLSRRNLREQAARIRDRAREIRTDITRHGKEPHWDLVQEEVTRPLTELHKHLSENLVRLESNKALVPIDRDPVPGRFSELVRSYFENLGEDRK